MSRITLHFCPFFCFWPWLSTVSSPARRINRPQTVILNAQVADGTGAPLRKANVRISGDRIVAIGEFKPKKASKSSMRRASSSLPASSTFTTIPPKASTKIPSPKHKSRKVSPR